MINTTRALASLGLGFGLLACTVQPNDPDPQNVPSPVIETPADAGAPDAAQQPSACNFGEPNNTREQSTPLEFGKAIRQACLADGDVDFYGVKVPSDGKGGYVQVKVRNVIDGRVKGTIYAVDGNGRIADAYTTTRGADLDLYVAVEPGIEIRIALEPWGGGSTSFEYDVEATYTETQDAYEPNDTKELAKSVPLNTPVQGYLVANYKTKDLGTFDDWFKVELTAGTVTIELKNIDADVRGRISVRNPAGVAIRSHHEATRGADVRIDGLGIPTSGTYYVIVDQWMSSGRQAGGGPLPGSFTKPYSLTVSQ